MKKLNLKKILLGSISAFLFSSSYSQTLINKEWDKSTGNPSLTYDFTVSTLDANNRLIVVGNSVMGSQKENFLITKYDKDGSTLWQSNFDKAGFEDFATAVATYGNETYVTGVANEVGNGDFNYLTMKLDANGGIVWVRTYNGTGNATDAPTAIKLDASGNVYVTGGSTGNGTLMDFCTIKYDNNGNEIWVSRYDFNGNYDGAIGLDVDPNGTSIVTGASGTSFQNWDFLTMKLDANGNTVATERTVTAGNSFDKPVDIKRDDQGNIYIAGSTQTNGNDINIKLIKISSNFQLQWQKTFDGAGLKDEASEIDIDANGNVYLAGYTEKANGGKDLLIKKYGPSGVEIWERRKQAADIMRTAKANGLEIDANGNIYVTGETEDGSGEKKYVTEKYDPNGDIAWEREYKKLLASGAKAQDIRVDNLGNVYVVGKTEDASSSEYTTVKYDQFKVPFEGVYDQHGDLKYSNVKFVVKTQPQNIKTDAINQFDRTYGTLRDFYQDDFVDTIIHRIGLTNDDEKAITVSKIYSFATEDTISISRQNTEVVVPKFWTSLLWHIPTSPSRGSLTVDTLIHDLLQSPDLIDLAEHSYYFKLASGEPNDTNYIPFQQGLRPTPFSLKGDINVENLWNKGIYGKDSVYVGLIDGGVDKSHEDLNGSYKKGFWLNKNTPNMSPYDRSGHGTMMAGIIGATRNNHKGIAGIAGGDDSLGIKGVSIFDFNAANPLNNTTFLDAPYVYNMIAEASYYYGDTNSIGVHVLNNSYYYDTDSFQISFGELRRAVEFALANGVTFVCAKANTGTFANAFPSSFTKSGLMIRVGASSSNGQRMQMSSLGFPIDFVAPGETDMYYSTVASKISGNANTYDNYMVGTSVATAHVSGAASLLLSGVNPAYKSHDNLAPEDVKYLLTKSVRDVYPAGVDAETGNGLIDVDGAFGMIDPADYKILHFEVAINDANGAIGISNGSFKSATGYWFNMYPDNAFTDVKNTFSVPNGKYNADGFSLGVTHYHQIPAGYTFVDAWARNSASSGIGRLNTTVYNPPVFLPVIYDDYLDQANFETNIEIVSADAASATLRSYYYHFTSNSEDSLHPVDFWIPMNPTIQSQFNTYVKAPMAYSVLVKGSPTGIKDVKEDNSNCLIYPIPASNVLKVKLLNDNSKDNKLTLYSLIGELVLEKSFQGSSLELNTTDLSAGAYIAKVTSEHGSTTKRITIIK